MTNTVDNYFGDLENVFFVGDSAGAQMASQYLAAVTNPEYADLLGLDSPAFTVRAAALNWSLIPLLATLLSARSATVSLVLLSSCVAIALSFCHAP